MYNSDKHEKLHLLTRNKQKPRRQDNSISWTSQPAGTQQVIS